MKMIKFPYFVCCSLLISVWTEAREIFSPVQDIIKINTTDTMATFELHCSHSSTICRFVLINDDQKTIQADMNLEPKRSYQRHTFDNLEPKCWYRITKLIDGNVIESGRFRTRMQAPSVPKINELFCLNPNELLVRWSPPIPVHQEGKYSFRIEWWPNTDPNHLYWAVVSIQNDSQQVIDPYSVIIRNLSNENYRLQIQSHLFDTEYRYDLFSDFSSNQEFNCIINNDINMDNMEILWLVSIIFLSIFATLILLLVIWYRYNDFRSTKHYDLEHFQKQFQLNDMDKK
ncbi:uncharacterized protein LOC124490436 [Dermatophagoides farinae]|uniref:uncharacterized protein LOC124490436 n=1 Tax=Dermatophagoides farinae TaxID=6954 RepID=UPI003F63C356